MPVMCAYKLVTCNFRWFGIQGLVESYIAKVGLLIWFQLLQNLEIMLIYRCLVNITTSFRMLSPF